MVGEGDETGRDILPCRVCPQGGVVTLTRLKQEVVEITCVCVCETGSERHRSFTTTTEISTEGTIEEPGPPAVQPAVLQTGPLVTVSNLVVIKIKSSLFSGSEEVSLSHPSLLCVECLSSISDVTAHFPSMVCCSLCKFITCCSISYANHMIK